jgi:hypothetical protein
MNKWKLSAVLLLLLIASLTVIPTAALGAEAGAGQLAWSEVKTGTYQPLSPSTLNWTGNVLDKGGMNLSTLKITTASKEADLVINQYGAIGATSMLKLSGEQLSDPTPANKTGFTNSYTMAKGDMYLILLNDGKYAKLRIDRILPENGAAYQQVDFSFVLESEALPPAVTTTPAATGPLTAQPTTAQQPGAQQPAAQQPGVQQTTTQWTTVQPTGQQQPSPQPPLTPQPTQPSASPSANPPQPTSLTPAKAASSIRLTVGERIAYVNGSPVQLDVAPEIVNGMTLVPLRFLAEALGSEVKWDGAERKITLSQQDKTIHLWIDQPFADVNGKTMILEASPSIVNETTVVPIRFISENFNQKVAYEEATRRITITGEVPVPGATRTAITNEPAQGQSTTAGQGAVTGLGFVDSLIGNWEFVNVWMPELGSSGSLSIYSNGTYELKKKNEGEFIGVWSVAKPGEVENQAEAIILSSRNKNDLAAVPDPSGNIKLLEKHAYSTNTLYDSKIITYWSPYSEASKVSDDPAYINQFKAKDYDFSTFVGTYDLWIEGGATNYYFKDTGNYATHDYQAGAAAEWLTVNADGTYTMKTPKETKSGLWRESKINEVYGYDYSIILQDGPEDINWALLVNNNGKRMVAYDSGHWADGSIYWLPYYIASPRE